jgi:hypothetical protein
MTGQDKGMRAMTMTSAGRITTLYGLAALLASCSAEPSGSDISKALNGSIKAEQNQLKGLTAGLTAGLPSGATPLGKMMSIEVTNLEKIGCMESGEQAYVCNVRYIVKGGLFGDNGRSMAVPVRMVHASDGWVVSAR